MWTKFVQLVMAAVIGAVIPVVGFAYWLGGWQNAIENDLADLQGQLGEVSKNLESLKSQTSSISGIDSNPDRMNIAGELCCSEQSMGRECVRQDIG